MPYRVTYAIDSLDPNPTVKTFEDEWEALDWVSDEINARASYIVEHSPYTISDEEYQHIIETEQNLTRIERI